MDDLSKQAVIIERESMGSQDAGFGTLGGVIGHFNRRASILNGRIQQRSRTYDAIVDASGQGDFKTIEAAVTYVTSLGGGDIFIHAGTYKPLSTITINVPMTIIGAGPGLVTVNFGSSTRKFSIVSTNIYSTGTITSITGGTAVVGSGTTWTAAMAGRSMFLGTKWYTIASVTDTTHLTLAEPYFDDLSLSAYKIATVTNGVFFEGMTIKNSTASAITALNARNVFIVGCVFVTNGTDIDLTNVYEIIMNGLNNDAATSDSIKLTNCGDCLMSGVVVVAPGGHGFNFSTVKEFVVFGSGSELATSNGMNLVSTEIGVITIDIRSATGKGIELVSGCNQINIVDSFVKASGSDNIKLTASANYCKMIGNHLDTAGGWGINIATNTSNKNVVTANSFNTNVSGTIQDNGTGDIVLAGSNTA